MKFFMIAGAIAGFITGLAGGVAAHRDGPAMLLEASLLAAAFGLLTRWWGRVWATGLRGSIEQRLAEAETQRREAKNGHPAKT